MAELQVLHLEDNLDDSELLVLALEDAGLNCAVVRLDSETDFVQALRDHQFDLIVSDFTLPNFDGKSALKYANQHYPEIPFIFVSGTIGESAAIESLLNGATDYVLKHNLSRLAPAIHRALKDTSERKQHRLAERAIRESEAKYRMLFEYSPNGILIANSENHYIDVNGSVCRMFGYSRDELIGLNPSDIVAEADLTHIGRALDSIETNSNYKREWRFRRKDGSAFDAELISTMMPDGNRLAIIRDITEQKHFEWTLNQKNLELQDASRMKSEFLATMSHELRTPLNSIIGFSEVLIDGLVGEITDKQRGFIGNIFSSGNHLLVLINDILDMSKVEAGEMRLDLESVPITPLLNSSLAIVSAKAAACGIRMDMDVPEELGLIQVDARRVKQIIYNLLSNAVKFSKEGGRVSLLAVRVPSAQVGSLSGPWKGRTFPLTASTFAEFIKISITDGGIGISAAGLNRLFKPFSQVDSTLARQFEGTGLGLSIVKLLTELHGGTVAVESSEGEGSCFTIWLPLRPSEEVAPESTKALFVSGIEARSEAPTALVVDDDFKSAELIRMHLEAKGFRVLHAASAEAALVLALQQPVSLITLDVLLPNMGGWEFLTRLKQVPELQRVPVLIISIVADSKKGFSLGAATVMQKPIYRHGLYQSLEDLGLLP